MKYIDFKSNYRIYEDGTIELYGVSNKPDGYVVKGVIDKKGYKRVTIDGKRYFLHRLVAELFIPNPYNLPQINHKDENPGNNAASNLEWCDAKYNSNYGNRNKKISEKQKRQPSCRQIGKFTEDGRLLCIYPSIREAARQNNTYSSNISQCCKGNSKYTTVKGFIWRYI